MRLTDRFAKSWRKPSGRIAVKVVVMGLIRKGEYGIACVHAGDETYDGPVDYWRFRRELTARRSDGTVMSAEVVWAVLCAACNEKVRSFDDVVNSVTVLFAFGDDVSFDDVGSSGRVPRSGERLAV